MKLLPLCLAFGLVAPVCAQAPVGSRALSRVEISRQSWPSFRRYAHGDYVAFFAALQFLLRNQGFFKGMPEGIFGAQTERAVKAFQRAKGLKPDGVVGAQTWAKLCPRLKRGDRGDAVRALQAMLPSGESGEDAEASIAVDGIFGFATEQALRAYQKRLGIKVDGVAGAQTWAALLSLQED